PRTRNLLFLRNPPKELIRRQLATILPSPVQIKLTSILVQKVKLRPAPLSYRGLTRRQTKRPTGMEPKSA
ncbi:hypothetical protein ACI3PL_21415, partial [Lacticaseibacillus paracasei]